ncbi:MAG: hypothetical protein ACOC7X_01595 [Spirochaetota bacterium]
MINITIEIDGVHQLMRTDAHVAHTITEEIHSLFPVPLFQEEVSKGPFYRFSCNEDEHMLYKIVEVLKTLHKMQTDWSNEIPGFSVLVQKSGGLLHKSQTKNGIGNEIFLLPEENGIWCTLPTADIISHFVHFKQVGNFLKIVDFERETLSPQDIPDLFEPDGLYDQLIDLILEIDAGRPAIPVIFGQRYSGKRLLIQSVLQAIEAGMGGVDWYHIDYVPALGSAFSSLLYRIDEKVIAEFEYLLSKKELQIWAQLQPLRSLSVSTWASADLELFFQLYLKAYGRRMKRELLPPVMVIHGFDQYPPEVRSFLAAEMERLLHSGEGIPVVTLRKESAYTPLEDAFEAVRFDISEWHSKLQERFGVKFASPYAAFEYGGDPPKRRNLFHNAPEELHVILYACYSLNGLCAKPKLLELFGLLGIRSDVAEQSLYQLIALGYVSDGEYFLQTRPALPSAVKQSKVLDRTRTNYIIEQFVVSHLSELNFYELVQVAKKLEFTARSLSRIVHRLVEELLSDTEVPLQPLIAAVPEWLAIRDKAGLKCIELLACLWDGALDAAAELYSELFDQTQEHLPPESEVPQVLFLFAEGAYLWQKRGEYQLVLSKAKQALLQVQEQAFPELEARATLLLGKVMLTNGRMSEAAEYFRQARQKTFDTPLTAAACESTALTALTHFVTGDYSLASSHSQAALLKARETGRRRWERYTMMLQARIQFELGRYSEAHILFQELLTHDRLYFDGERRNLLTAWLLRSHMYQGFIHTAEEVLGNLPETGETLYFQAEGHLLNRDMGEAYRYVEAAINYRQTYEQHDILPIVHLAGDGYEPYENFALKIPRVYDVPLQLLYALKGFLLHELGREEESEAAFERLFSQERLTRQDPYRHLYYYFRTITQPVHSEKEELNMTTMLSKAFQSLQKIAGRISDPSDRRSYTTMNYWNSRLFALSRRYKLV